MAGRGELCGDEWETERGKLARLLLCDQLSRNAFRGTSEVCVCVRVCVRSKV